MGVLKVTNAVALQGWWGDWCAWGETTDPVWHVLLLNRDFYPVLVRMLGRKTRQAVGQNVSTRNVSQQCLLPWSDYENHLPHPPPTSPLHFNRYLPYLLLYKSTPCKHTQIYTTTIFSVTFKDPLYCKCCSVQSWWRPVNLLLLRQSTPKARIQCCFGGCDRLFLCAGMGPTDKEPALWSYTNINKNQCAVTLLNASNFCYFYKSVIFYQQLNDVDVNNIIHSLMFEELLFL